MPTDAASRLHGTSQCENNILPSLSDYEQQRLLHIARNREYMALLGLVEDAGAQMAAQQAKGDAAKDDQAGRRKSRVKNPAPDSNVPCRRSGRLVGKQPDYTGLHVDPFGEDLDEIPAAGRKTKRVKVEQAEGERDGYQHALVDAQAWLQTNRDALLRTVHLRGEGGAVPGTADAGGNQRWKDEAMRRWGHHVAAVAVTGSDKADWWEKYVLSRMSTPPRASPEPLIQEYYCHDAWRLLCCCALMSRVSSAETKHRCIAAFFARCPTPSALLDAPPDDILRVVLPLGLFPTRFRSLVELSRRFIEMPEFDIALDGPNKIYGFGEFGYQSFLIFVRGDVSVRPSDKHLQAFVAWQNRRKQEQP